MDSSYKMDYDVSHTVNPAISHHTMQSIRSLAALFDRDDEAGNDSAHRDFDAGAQALADAPAADGDFAAALCAEAVRHTGADEMSGGMGDDEMDGDAPLRVRPSWGAALSQLPGLPAFEISFTDLGSSAARVVSFTTAGDVEEREVIYKGDARRAARFEAMHASAGAEETDDYEDDADCDADAVLEEEEDGDFDDVAPAYELERPARY